MAKVDKDLLRVSRQLDVATEGIEDLKKFRFDPHEPVASNVRFQMKIQAIQDRIRKLENLNTK